VERGGDNALRGLEGSRRPGFKGNPGGGRRIRKRNSKERNSRKSDRREFEKISGIPVWLVTETLGILFLGGIVTSRRGKELKSQRSERSQAFGKDKITRERIFLR